MKHVSSDADLKVLAALGVNHILGSPPSPRMDENWSVEGLTKFRERVESYGVQMDVIALPLPLATRISARLTSTVRSES
mgnify:CR=1 FL=1